MSDSKEPLRLSKLMAHRGLCSRREADKLIAEKQVYVNGELVCELGSKVLPDASIEIKQEGQRELDQKVTFLINKPVGYVSAQAEDDYIPAVRLIEKSSQDQQYTSEYSWHRNQTDGLAPAGRLDIDSKGLLILTQNGVVAKQVIGPDNCIEKEYIVKVNGEITSKKIKLLTHGLSLDGKALRQAKIRQINDHTINFILTEGKKRQIRRMCELVDLYVTSLERVRIGKIKLGRLKEGMWRYLDKNESF